MPRRNRRDDPYVGNPARGAKLHGMALEMRYQHAEDGELYEHAFERATEMWALPDGTVLLRAADGVPLWKEF